MDARRIVLALAAACRLMVAVGLTLDPTQLSDLSGGVLYCLEITKNYDLSTADTVDQLPVSDIIRNIQRSDETEWVFVFSCIQTETTKF
ncbi:hypothetical protein DM860_006783 [Cuscuta australis]|uniref:Uncharacterized protein n=1 Tax=Cuscuta australis TaxID=267555 RepID=A0A328E9E5_9ASTE|nr:hypothetical protein DM860_006783 [Cuscuta australis]